MQAERFQRVMQIVGEALERGPDSREVLVNHACAGDEELRGEVMRLLERQTAAVEFLEESPVIAASRAADQSFVGSRLGPYRIISEIARGGMGTVYLALRDDREFTKQVAIKLIKRGMDTDFVLQRFRNERQILAGLDHRNIARLIDGGTTNDLPYFIMEYVDGVPITKFADAHELGTNDRLKLFRTVCAAVQYAHQNLVIHRDLKPSNILVTKDGAPKLLDFGIAKLLHAEGHEETALTQAGLRVMTPEYASPEQVKGDRVTTSSDVYSLGVLLYELLTGQRPYRVKCRAPEDIAKAICEQEPTKPSVVVSSQLSMVSQNEQRAKSEGQNEQLTTDDGKTTNPPSAIRNPKLLRGDLDNIILKALRKEPERRYVSVEQFSEDIRRHLEGLPVTARKDTFGYRCSKFVQRHKIGVAAAAIVALTLVSGMIAIAWEAHRARIEQARAELRFNETRQLTHKVLFEYHDAIAAFPGSTAMREKLVRDAVHYLDELADDEGNSVSLQRELADGYERVAAVQGGTAMSAHNGIIISGSNLGDTAGALESFHKALSIRERLVSSAPNDNELRLELAYNYISIGFVHVLNGPPDQAVEYLHKGLPILESLYAANSENEDLQYKMWNAELGLAKSLGNPGVPNLGDWNGAMALMQKWGFLIERLASAHPDNNGYQQGLAAQYSGFGQMFRGASKEQEALQSFEKAAAIDQRLVNADTANMLYKRELAIQLGNVGTSELTLNDSRGAVEAYHQALAIYESMLAADPNDAVNRRNTAVAYRNLAAALGPENRLEALKNFTKALEIFASLVAKDPTNNDFRRQWAFTYFSLSQFQVKATDFNAAVESVQQGIKIEEGLVASAPTNVSARNTLALLYRQLGDSYAALGAKGRKQQWSAAKDAYQKALDIYQSLKNQGTLSGADASKPDELAKEIAKCDAVLRR